MNCFLYNKVLTQSPTNKTSTGAIINLIQLDSAKISRLIEASPDFFSLPIQFIMYNAMLFNLLGLSYFGGLFTLFLVTGISILTYTKQKKNIQNLMVARDDRMKLTAELISSLKILKLYSWEDYYLNKVKESRENELYHLKERFKMSTFNFFVFWFAPALLAIVSIGFYQSYNVEIKLDEILTAIAIFNNLQEPIAGVPWLISQVFETLNGLERIQVIYLIRF